MKKFFEITIPSAAIVICLVAIIWSLEQKPFSPLPTFTPIKTTSRPVPGPIVQNELPKIPSTYAEISDVSPELFAYAHGTVIADNKIFIGMANRSGNPFPTNQLYVFPDLKDLKQVKVISLPGKGDIEAMVYDTKNDQIYFTFSDPQELGIFGINPKNYLVYNILSTTSVSMGLRPAITTDGTYIYGITYTKPASVFKIGIKDHSFVTSAMGHISLGHSAAIGIYGSSTELYFGGSDDNWFEKVNAENMSSLGLLYFQGCSITDDMPFQKTSEKGGYVYIGCEKQPFGYRVSTDDMDTAKFDLPGSSFGMFIYGNDLYNVAMDGNFDLFRNMDIKKIKRYFTGQDLQLNELFVSADNDVYFTEWWGIKGLFKVDKSSLD